MGRNLQLWEYVLLSYRGLGLRDQEKHRFLLADSLVEMCSQDVKPVQIASSVIVVKSWLMSLSPN